MLHPAALLNTAQSREADKATIASGIPGLTLMENAGRAVADIICEHYSPCPVLVVCGTGNNGGDGFVAARHLASRGWPVSVALLSDKKPISNDALLARHGWEEAGGKTYLFEEAMLGGVGLVVDAMFGTGLARDLKGPDKTAVEAINGCKHPIIAVDMPSGIDADTAVVRGAAIRAAHTVSFVRPKIGHVLLPGKEHTGQLHVFDIGISGNDIKAEYHLNIPALWRDNFPFPGASSHKYTRGHAVILGGAIASSSAARLCATGALRAGAGLVSVACAPDSLPAYALTLTSVMTKPYANDQELQKLLEDKHTTALCIGPGYGIEEKTRERALQILGLKKPAVLDADALTAFKNSPKSLFDAIKSPTVLTPHEGEFIRLFKHEGLRPERALAAAKQSGAVVVLKGNDTIIASPDGRATINAEAPVWLATAGSGDVLSGIITGLLAQGMPAFEAACAGVWLHSRAAAHFGPGLIAEDIPAELPHALKTLYS